MRSWLVSTGLLIAISHASNKQYVATFGGGSNGVTGTVTVDDGQVIVNLDLSAQPALPDDFATCTTGGLSYHIHNSWGHGDNNDRLGATECGAAFTGGHWDPWNACGGASGSAYCDSTNAAPNSAECIPVSSYSTDFANNPFSAEVGDWSSKYGKLTLSGNNAISRTDSSFYEAMSSEMAGLSVVFHCNGGTRAFCAPFEVGSTDVTSTDLSSQASDITAVADFESALGTISTIQLFPNGDVDVMLDASALYVDDGSCAELKYGIFEAGASALTDASSACDGYVGAAYDPTNACLPYSASTYCTDGVLCTGSGYAYNCDWPGERYSCAPGDLSGKLGLITDPTAPFTAYHVGDNSLIPPPDSLIGKVMVIQCANSGINGYTPLDIACAPILSATEAPTEIPTSQPTTAMPTVAPTKQYVATFDSANNGIAGSVTVNDGQVILSLDLASQPALPGDFATCTTGGLSYHIHNKWGYVNNDDRMGATDCGADFTGGHWDPWNACGGASGSEWCDSTGNAVCIDTGAYSPDYAVNPFSAEIGDWSGKYGKVTLSASNTIVRTDSSFYEAMSREMQGLSVVFHCNGGSRAFCAPFVESSDEVTATTVTQDGATMDAIANFGDIGSISLYPSGAVDIDLDMSGVSNTCSGAMGYGIFEPATGMTLDGVSTSCGNYVGDQYDPTNACLANSESSFCDAGELCTGFSGSTYAYDCDFASDRYSCAPGDLAGKFGMITDPDNTPLVVNDAGDESLIPLTDSLIGKVMLIHCADATPVACAPITDGTTTNPTTMPTINPTVMPTEDTATTASPTAAADATKQYVATFTEANNGIEGSVTVNDGQVIVDLDLSSEPALPGGFAACTAGGLKWHIHNKWTHADDEDRLGSTECGSDFTGGHFDPWNACGPASGSAYCDKSDDTTGSLTGMCVPASAYLPNFDTDPFSAEVGDWSGKYGVLELDADNMISLDVSSYYEVISAEVAGLSVVFHCSTDGAPRAFCAPFVVSTEDVTAQELVQSTEGNAVFANFQAALTTESQVTLYPNGDILGTLDATALWSDTLGCDTLAYGIFEAGTNTLTESSIECANAVGAAYDPTDSCVALSESDLCMDGVLCDGASDSGYVYDCDFANDRFSCAPGDLSGKVGLITDPANAALTLAYGDDDSLLPITDNLVGKVMAIYCPNSDSTSSTYLACAPIEQVESDPGDGGGVGGVSVVMAFVVSLIALLH